MTSLTAPKAGASGGSDARRPYWSGARHRSFLTRPPSPVEQQPLLLPCCGPFALSPFFAWICHITHCLLVHLCTRISRTCIAPSDHLVRIARCNRRVVGSNPGGSTGLLCLVVEARALALLLCASPLPPPPSLLPAPPPVPGPLQPWPDRQPGGTARLGDGSRARPLPLVPFCLAVSSSGCPPSRPVCQRLMIARLRQGCMTRIVAEVARGHA